MEVTGWGGCYPNPHSHTCLQGAPVSMAMHAQKCHRSGSHLPKTGGKSPSSPVSPRGLVTRTDTGATRRARRQAELQRTKQVEVGDGATSLAQRTLKPSVARPQCPRLPHTRLVIW